MRVRMEYCGVSQIQPVDVQRAVADTFAFPRSRSSFIDYKRSVFAYFNIRANIPTA